MIRSQDTRRYSLFINKIDRLTEPDGCWKWIGSRDKDGYGHFLYGGRAHRWSYEYFNGPIPEGMFVCHTCDHPWCVNPRHLFLGTNQDNRDDMVAKGRSLSRTKNPAAKLTEEQVEMIRQDTRAVRAIAVDYPVGKSQIANIKSNKGWTEKSR